MSIQALATGLQHIGIPTDNMEETLKFYKAIGFEVALATTNKGNHVNFLKLGDLVIETYEGEIAHGCYGAIEHFCINVTDIETTYKEICELGLNNLNDQINFLPFWDNGVRYFTIEGPNKEKVEFGQML